MRPNSRVAVALPLLLLLLTAIPAAAGRELQQSKDVSTASGGRLIVALSKDGAELAGQSGSAVNTLSATLASAASVTSVQILPILNLAIVKSGNTALSTASLQMLSSVKSVSADVRVQIAGVPDDALYSSLWGIDKVEAPAAWDITTGSHSVVVCVIDTGKPGLNRPPPFE